MIGCWRGWLVGQNFHFLMLHFCNSKNAPKGTPESGEALIPVAWSGLARYRGEPPLCRGWRWLCRLRELSPLQAASCCVVGNRKKTVSSGVHLLGTSSAWRCRCGRARLSHVGLHPTALHCCELLNAGSKKVMTFH